MGFEAWIAIILVASGLSGWIGYAYARKGAPAQSELDALASELEEARRASESVQSNVNEHFEQSALLFGKLAADYREFLEHFSDSAQALGLSESRAREIIEQGFQPLLTHEDPPQEGAVALAEEAVAEEAPTGEALAEEATTEEESPAEENLAETAALAAGDGESAVAEVTVEMPEEAADAAVDPVADGSAKEADRQRA